MKPKSRIKSESTVFLAVLFGILIFANILSLKFFARGDLTRDGLFTLSRASIDLVRGLDDRLVVKAYFTKNLPGRFAALERHVRDLLDEYQQHSNGRMTVEFIDPQGNEEEEKVAQALGINKMPNPDIDKDQATVKEGYRGIAFSFGSNTEVIPAVDSPEGLEYEITTVLKQIAGNKSTVGFLTGHGEPEIDPPDDPTQPMSGQDGMQRGAFRNLRSNLQTYVFKQFDMKNGEKETPEGLNAIFIVGPTKKIEEKEIFRIDQFLLKGGAVAIFVDGVNVEIGRPQFPGMPATYNTAINDTGLKEFLKHHGIDLGGNLVFDRQAAAYVAQCPPIPLPLPRPYAAWPLITSFGEQHPISFRLGSLTMPYASTVRLNDAARKDPNKEAREIAFSSGNAWTAEGSSANIDPCSIVESRNLESSIPMAAAVKGKFTSFFKGKKLPVDLPSGEGPAAQPLAGKDAFLETSSSPGRLVVVGSSRLPSDEGLVTLARMNRRQAQDNFYFVQNIFDWLTSEEELISVRMKTVDDPPLEKASEGLKAAAKYGNIAGIPFLFIVFGLVRWRIRSGRRTKAAVKKSGE